MERYICIHGHFYQPPRENPWLEAIELQDSAYPHHDWNERITVECYAPNSVSRILDGEGRIARITNNFARISFNFGPTLLSWLEAQAPDTYRSVVEADRESRQTFSGHGSAIAQAYNHVILPLANRRDKYTQVIWGIRDFEHRFGRRPEAMWLPETAVDLETLDILAELGITFTILSPYQAQRVRRRGGRSWVDVSGGRIDPSRAYQLRLPSGRTIDLFFYDGIISRAVAFENLLSSGEEFAQRLLSGFAESRSWPQLVHIATDGETYGHHYHYGDMALAYALHHIESNQLARVTNYGEFLELHRPTHEVEIFENSSWSCPHGVERWRSNCGCKSGGHGDWNQEWRAPLRAALDWLRDEVAPRYVEAARQLVRDPWKARDDYISVILDRSPENAERFLARHAVRPLTERDRVTLLKLLELQRHALLMYTSCGWFFDELSGIETVQVIQYAGRAIQLAQDVLGQDLEPGFLKLMGSAKSNIPEHRDGAHIYEKFVRPAMVDLKKVAAHYATRSLFEPYPERAQVYCYTVEREDEHTLEAGEAKLGVGTAVIRSEVTGEWARLSYGALYFGDHNLNAGVRPFRGEDAYQTVKAELSEAFNRADLAESIRLLDRHFEGATYSLRSLFRDEQRKILSPIVEATTAEAVAAYRQIYVHHGPLMRFLRDLGTPIPQAFRVATEAVINADLRRAFQDEDLDLERIPAILTEAGRWGIPLDGAGLGFTLRRNVEQMMERLRDNPSDQALLQRLLAAVDLIHTLPFPVDLWRVQNVYHEMLQAGAWDLRRGSRWQSEAAQAQTNGFIALGEKLGLGTQIRANLDLNLRR